MIITTEDTFSSAIRGQDLISEIGGMYLHYEGGQARFRGNCVDYAMVVWEDKDGNLMFDRPDYLPEVYAEICVDDDPTDDCGNLINDDAHRDELYEAITDMLDSLGIPSNLIPDDLLGKSHF